MPMHLTRPIAAAASQQPDAVPFNAAQRAVIRAGLLAGQTAAEMADAIARAGRSPDTTRTTAAPSAAPKPQTITQFAASVIAAGARRSAPMAALARDVWAARRAAPGGKR